MSDKMKFIVGATNNWYDENIVTAIDLIEAYIEQCEISNSIAITEYDRYKVVEVEEYEYGANFYTHFRLLDGYTFNVKDIITNEFPKMNRHSTLVLIMSMFERVLKNLCDSVHSFFGLNTAFKKSKGSLLSNVRTYLTTEANIRFNKILEKQWSDLMCLQSIRNNITHNFGYLEVENEHVTKYLSANKNVRINENKEFVFNHEFLKDLIPNFRLLCKELQEAIRTKTK